MNENIAAWWDTVYVHAVSLEKLITPAPETVPEAEIPELISKLGTLYWELENIECPEESYEMLGHLLRAAEYLRLCYQEILQKSSSESEFYYSSALTQVAQLHYQLVRFRLTKD
jgi:hypothetical protein